MDPSTLAAAASSALIPYLTEGDRAVAKAGAEELYRWLKERLAPSGREALAEVAKAPGDADAWAMFRRQVRKLLEAEPTLVADLARLLEALPLAEHRQIVSGSGNTVVQISGRGTTVPWRN